MSGAADCLGRSRAAAASLEISAAEVAPSGRQRAAAVAMAKFFRKFRRFIRLLVAPPCVAPGTTGIFFASSAELYHNPVCRVNVFTVLDFGDRVRRAKEKSQESGNFAPARSICDCCSPAGGIFPARRNRGAVSASLSASPAGQNACARNRQFRYAHIPSKFGALIANRRGAEAEGLSRIRFHPRRFARPALS